MIFASPLESHVLFAIGPVPISQPVATTWGIMAVLTIGSWLLTRRLALRPTRAQAALELVVETVAGPWFARAEAALHASGLMISPLSCSVMEQWLLDGTADAVSLAFQEEAGRRRIVAAELLGGAHRAVEQCVADGVVPGAGHDGQRYR